MAGYSLSVHAPALTHYKSIAPRTCYGRIAVKFVLPCVIFQIRSRLRYRNFIFSVVLPSFPTCSFTGSHFHMQIHECLHFSNFWNSFSCFCTHVTEWKMTKMSFNCLFPSSFFIISNLKCTNTTLYTKCITTLHIMQEHLLQNKCFSPSIGK